MRWSQLLIPTLKETPSEAEIVSHQLMLRAGLIRRLGSGLYTYLPLANRIFQSAPITVGDWAQILVVAVTVYLLVEFEKAYRRRKTGMD